MRGIVAVFLLLACGAALADETTPLTGYDTSAKLAPLTARKIDFSRVIVGIDGPFKECRKYDDAGTKCIDSVDLTLGRLCVTAAALPDKSTPVQEQVLHGKLAMKLLDAKEIALSIDDIVFLKSQIGKLGYNALAVYQAIKLLDPASD